MYKNQLQELAQRSCFNLPSYTCIREGPDHAPRFKASVNFNGEIFESPTYCSTLRQAEHAAAEVALNSLSSRGPSRFLTARVLDETGIYKNLLQETAHRAGLDLPVYTNVRSGPGHTPTFSCTVELAGMSFTGEPAKTKKQAEKNAAIAAWSALKKMRGLDSLAEKEGEEKEQEVVARVLSSFRPKEVKRREPHQSRRRTLTRSHRDTNSDLLSGKLRLINLLSNSHEASSSQKHHQTSFISQIPPPKSSRILPNNSSRVLSSVKPFQQQSREESQEKFQECVEKGHLAKTEMIIKSLPLPTAQNNTTTNDSPTHRSSYSKLLPFSDKATTAEVFYKSRGLYTGGFSLNPHRMAPAVQIRSVIPVCAAPPPQPAKPNPNPSSSSPSVNESASLRHRSATGSAISCEMSKLGFQTKSRLGEKSDQTHD
ncbi:PREDICTED: double-stranded RNA-binding protein 3-like [Tarenaya hassleriana]|uniref:double-stranded RNA-binding protein 3-like n=1 Tax=Tarenaya hassleriana TaxID=28532 RepID=UPI00053C6CEE|nr:PREDICTED: double-stranded RNA-binding protein 3-like [Tarenaya hassleriana]